MNNTAIAATKPGDILWDDRVSGLHLRAFPSKKTFYLQYRTKDGRRQRRPKIGDLGTVTLAEARQIAGDMLKAVARGEDPVAERGRRRVALTFNELADRYLKHIRTDPKDRKKPSSIANDELTLKVHLRPRWGRRLAEDITREDVEEMHRAMAKTPYQANRTLALASRMFNLAEAWRTRPERSNPCRLVQRYPERKRRRYMRSIEAPVIADLLAKYEAERSEAVLFIYLLILTGARPDEIARAGRKHLDGNRLVLLEHKTDRTTAPRVIYLPSRVMTLIEKVGTADSLTGIKSPRSLWRKIRREAGCPDLRLYDLRRTFASAALRAGYTLDQIGELLGHTSGTTAKRYAWLLEDLGAEAAEKTADVLTEMMQPKALPRQ
ncbi:MAG: tyrosine-type recombinase/integrase [Pseudomonadota bacterium]